jgi:DNA-binding transcriptional MerR regulator
MRVGEVAARTGVSVRSIRHYERAGLLRPERAANGYRVFAADAVERVRAIHDLLQSGFNLQDVSALSACLLASGGDPDCCGLTAEAYRRRLERVEQQLATLRRLRGRILERIRALEPCAVDPDPGGEVA